MTDFMKKGAQAAAYLAEQADPADTVEEVTFVVQEAWDRPFTTKSDFAREHASHVAAATCLGFITTADFCPEAGIDPLDGVQDFGSTYRVTVRGAKLISTRATRT